MVNSGLRCDLPMDTAPSLDPNRTTCRTNSARRALALVVAGFVLSGCGRRAAPAPPAAGAAAPPVINILPPPPPPPPPVVRPLALVLNATNAINPGLNQRAAPVMVRVYELKSSTAFDAADFFALHDKEREVLGADLLHRDEFQIRPGERVQLSRKLTPGIRRLAVTVAFRELERSIWKDSITIGEPVPDEVRVLIDTRQVRILAQ